MMLLSEPAGFWHPVSHASASLGWLVLVLLLWFKWLLPPQKVIPSRTLGTEVDNIVQQVITIQRVKIKGNLLPESEFLLSQELGRGRV